MGKPNLRIYRRILEKHILPFLGCKPVDDIRTPELLALLKHFEAQGRVYLARQIAMLCGMIMRYAVAVGKAESDPTPSLRGSLKTHRAEHRAAITDPRQVGRLLRAIDAYPGSMTLPGYWFAVPLLGIRLCAITPVARLPF